MILALLLGATPVQFDTTRGIRIGYAHLENMGLRSPDAMVLGYEQMHKVDTGTALDFLIVANLSVLGMNQGVVYPTGHVLLGYQLKDSFYLAAGPFVSVYQLEPEPEAKLNMLIGAGWTIPMEGFSVPIELGYVPDLDNQWRFMFNTGIDYAF